METRKLQATGGASLTLTLPKTWVNERGLQSKDEVVVSQDGKALVIKPAASQENEYKIDINIDELAESWLVRELIGAYIAGADKITFRSDNISSAQRQIIHKAAQLLFGFELLEETTAKVYIKNIFDDAKLPAPQSTQKIFLIARTMFEDALKAVETGDQNLALDIQQRDFEVNKLLYAVKRQYYSRLIGKTEGSAAEIGYYMNVAVQLERIADHAVQIARISSGGIVQTATYDNFSVIQDQVRGLFDDTGRVIHSLDKSLAHKILDHDKSFKRLISGTIQSEKSSERVLTENSLDRLRGYVMNIAELTIDYAFIV